MRATCISRWKGENRWEAGAVAVGMTAAAAVVVVAVVAMVSRGSSGGTGGGGCSPSRRRGGERKVAGGLELDCRRFCAQPSPAQDSPPA